MIPSITMVSPRARQNQNFFAIEKSMESEMKERGVTGHFQ